MKYQANPVIVDAFKITGISRPVDPPGDGCGVLLDDGTPGGEWREVTPGMTSRMTPGIGDYWVVQSDGYAYLNPKDVFERKYSPLSGASA